VEPPQRTALARHDGGRRGTGLAPTLAVGGICGLAWAAGLRGFMAEIAGSASNVEWAGTFGWILLPGVLVGVLLGWAEQLRRTGGRRGWRWLALAPLLLASVLFSAPGDMGAMLQDGIGGGALAVPLFGMAAGYALSGRGPTWGRLVCGVIALAPIPIWVLVAPWVGGPALAVTTPRGAWVALYYYSFLAVLGLGCSIPHRPPAVPPDGARPLVTTRTGTGRTGPNPNDGTRDPATDPSRASVPAGHGARRTRGRSTGEAPEREPPKSAL
jgi:hypothetical protein